MKLSPSHLLAPASAAAVLLAASLALAGCGADPGGSTEGSATFDLKVGDCLNDGDVEGTVGELPTVDCSEPHDSEVFAVFDATAQGDTMPSDDELTAQADEGCAPAFAEFIGLPYGESLFSYASYTPTLSSWYEDGGQSITCVVFDPEGKTEGSLESIGL